MSLQTLLFSFQGRIGRQAFWLWNICYYAMIAGFAMGSNLLFPDVAHLILPVFLLVVLVPDLAITAKRWHDRDKSSWWLLLNVPLVIGRMTIPAGELAVNTQTRHAGNTYLVCGVTVWCMDFGGVRISFWHGWQ